MLATLSFRDNGGEGEWITFTDKVAKNMVAHGGWVDRYLVSDWSWLPEGTKVLSASIRFIPNGHEAFIRVYFDIPEVSGVRDNVRDALHQLWYRLTDGYGDLLDYGLI